MAEHRDGPPGGSDRRERERLARREEILDAARRIFAARGYHAVTLDEIAAEARFSKGALYGYFRNKEDLYATLLEEQFDRIEAAMREVVEKREDPLDVLREMIRLHLEQHAERRDLFAEFGKGQARLVPGLGAEGDSRQRLVERFRTRFFTNLDILTEAIERGIQAGKLGSNMPARQAAVSLLGLVHSNFFYWLVQGMSEPLDTLANRVTQLFFEGIHAPMEDR